MNEPEADTPDTPDAPEPALELVARAPRYEWAESVDEERRAFVMEHFASADMEGNVWVSNAQRAFLWLKYGQVPQKPKGKLKVVEDGSSG